jgi:hypothetical protein
VSARRSALGVTVCKQALDPQQRGGTTERDEPCATLTNVAGEQTPTSDASAPPSTAPRTPTSSRPVWGAPSAGMEDAIQPATTPKIIHAAKPIVVPLLMNAGHESFVPTWIRSHTMLGRVRRSGNTA